MPDSRQSPLDMALLAELPSLSLQARYMVDGFSGGRHRSPQKGSSVEFAEYRDYQFGDDLRRVDWRLYARTDRLHVKQFEEETQMRVFTVLDTSASMNFRSPGALFSKIEYARLIAASMGLLAHRQGDAFGLALAGQEIRDFLRARCSVPHWRSYVGKLDALESHGEASLADCLNLLAQLIPARSMIVVISDFYGECALLASALRRLRHDHHEVIGIHVLDPVEIDFDFGPSGTFLDAETGECMDLDARAVRDGYLRRFGAFCKELDASFHDAGGGMSRHRTDQPPLEALASYLARRKSPSVR